MTDAAMAFPAAVREGGRRWLTIAVGLAAGAAAALAFPPFGLLPGLLGYAALLWLCDGADGPRRLRSAFWRGWLAGCAFFAISTWWVAEAFLVDRTQTWMAPMAVGLMVSGFGLFWGAATALYAWIRPRGATRVLVFAGCFCLLEWLRGHVLTGFPWDLAGETWKAGTPVSEAASIVGAYGLSWITVAVAATPALLVEQPRARGAWIAMALAGLGLAGLWGYGCERLAHAAALSNDGLQIRVVQANVSQSSKYDQALFRSILNRYTSLTALPAVRTPAVVIWPEGAVPAMADDYLAQGTWTRAQIAAALKPGESLLVGAARGGRDPESPTYNSLLALRNTGGDLKLTGVYDKFRLVPFGEYLPADNILTPLGFKIMAHIGDGFSAGPRPRPIRPEGLPALQPLICYESLFPGFVRDGARTGGRPVWIANVSNDAWFGPTSGPWQHLNLASYRAIEEGLPVVRATPTGISAVIDGYGRVVPGAQLGQGVMGVIDAILPPALAPTLFTRWGGGPFWLMMTLSFALTLFCFRKSLNRFNLT